MKLIKICLKYFNNHQSKIKDKIYWLEVFWLKQLNKIWYNKKCLKNNKNNSRHFKIHLIFQFNHNQINKI